ncbi:hypothetical protein ACTFIW_012123 [Dictyostelium discoideum]
MQRGKTKGFKKEIVTLAVGHTDTSWIYAANCLTKSLLVSKKVPGGRNNNGHITCLHRGDFKRDKLDIQANVASIGYDPNRYAFIFLLNYRDGEKRYTIADDTDIASDENSLFTTGCSTQLRFMPIDSVVHSIELITGKVGRLVRSAGMSAQLMGRNNGFATIRLPSGYLIVSLSQIEWIDNNGWIAEERSFCRSSLIQESARSEYTKREKVN